MKKPGRAALTASDRARFFRYPYVLVATHYRIVFSVSRALTPSDFVGSDFSNFTRSALGLLSSSSASISLSRSTLIVLITFHSSVDRDAWPNFRRQTSSTIALNLSFIPL